MRLGGHGGEICEGRGIMTGTEVCIVLVPKHISLADESLKGLVVDDAASMFG